MKKHHFEEKGKNVESFFHASKLRLSTKAQPQSIEGKKDVVGVDGAERGRASQQRNSSSFRDEAEDFLAALSCNQV